MVVRTSPGSRVQRARQQRRQTWTSSVLPHLKSGHRRRRRSAVGRRGLVEYPRSNRRRPSLGSNRCVSESDQVNKGKDSMLPALIAIGLTVAFAFFALVPLVDWITIQLAYGSQAYADGLRFESSKQDILSNGQQLSAPWRAFRIFCFISGIVVPGFGLGTLAILTSRRFSDRKQLR